MSEPQGKMKLTQEELQQIMKLPKRTLRFGAETRSGYYDAENSKFYACDESGQLTGKVATVKAPEPATAPVAKAAQTTTDAPTKEEKKKDEAAESKPNPLSSLLQKVSEKIPKPEKKDGEPAPADDGKALPGSTNRILAAVTVLALVVSLMSSVACFVSMQQMSAMRSEGPSDDEIGTTVEVIRLARTLLPGQQIIETDLEKAELDEAMVQQFSLFGRDLCSWDTSTFLVGAYAESYMAAGHYMELTDVTAAHPVTDTPWEADAGTQWTIALDAFSLTDSTLTFGSVVSAEIRAVFTNQVAGSENGGPTITGSGIVHTTTTSETSTISEYSLQQLVVVDILNANRESLYPTYHAYTGIPVGERRDYIAQAMRDDPDLETRLTPCYVVLRLLNDQVPVISQISSADSSEVLIRNTANIEQNTEEKRSESIQLQSIRPVIQMAASYNAQLLAEQEALASQGE